MFPRHPPSHQEPGGTLLPVIAAIPGRKRRLLLEIGGGQFWRLSAASSPLMGHDHRTRQVAGLRDWTIGGGVPLAASLVEPAPTGAAAPWWERDDVFHWIDTFTGGSYRWRHAGAVAGAELHTALGWTQARRSVAALAGWPVMNTRQLAAFTGHPPSNAARHLRPLFLAGVVDRGRLPMGLLFGHKGHLHRLSTGPELGRFLAGLSPADRARTTMGVPIRRGHGTVRHHLLVAELALRVAELVPGVVAVFPGSVSSPARLLGHLGRTATWHADLTIVRADGLRIAVELTRARSRRSLDAKMHRWAELLAGHHRHETGLVVVFLNAACTSEGTIGELRRHHRKWAAAQRDAYARVLSRDGLLVDGMRALPAELRAARSQIHLASWMDWFPALGRVSSAFVELSTVFAAEGRQWRREALADPTGFWGFDPTGPILDRVDAPRRARVDVWACPRFLTAASPVPGAR